MLYSWNKVDIKFGRRRSWYRRYFVEINIVNPIWAICFANLNL